MSVSMFEGGIDIVHQKRQIIYCNNTLPKIPKTVKWNSNIRNKKINHILKVTECRVYHSFNAYSSYHLDFQHEVPQPTVSRKFDNTPNPQWQTTRA